MKVKVSIQSEDGQEWTAQAKDIGLTTTGCTMMSALEEMQDEIQKFFADAFGSKKQIEVICSKIKANAAVTVSPLDPRPEVPLDNFTQEPLIRIDGQDILDGQELLQLPPGEEEIEIEGADDSSFGIPGETA